MLTSSWLHKDETLVTAGSLGPGDDWHRTSYVTKDNTHPLSGIKLNSPLEEYRQGSGARMRSGVSQGWEGTAKIVTLSSVVTIATSCQSSSWSSWRGTGVMDLCTLLSWDVGKLEQATIFVQISELDYEGYCAENSLGKRRHSQHIIKDLPK